jgi:hypothetical protein
VAVGAAKPTASLSTTTTGTCSLRSISVRIQSCANVSVVRQVRWTPSAPNTDVPEVRGFRV